MGKQSTPVYKDRRMERLNRKLNHLYFLFRNANFQKFTNLNAANKDEAALREIRSKYKDFMILANEFKNF